MIETFYGLTGRPFQLTPDPAFYFESLTHRKALSYLSFGLSQGEGFIIITGEVGAGKSTLVAHLMATIDRARLTAAQIVTSALGGGELVQLVAQSFGLPVAGHDKAAALGAIEHFLHNEARAGRRCLLVVDESQNLSPEALEELRMLSNFQLGSHPLLQVLLLGQPEFRDCIHGHPGLEQLRQRIIAAHHLEAMQEQEIEPYITHRMRLVGWTGNPAFEPALFAALHGASGGVPRRLNQLMNRLLILGALEQRQLIDVAMLRQVQSELGHDSAHRDLPAHALAPVAPASAVHQPVAAPAPAPAPTSAPTSAPASEPAASFTLTDLHAALAERDAQIAELQQAGIELAGNHEAVPSLQADPALLVAPLEARLHAMEARMLEQERTIRHTLTMLIEWIERDDMPRVAA